MAAINDSAFIHIQVDLDGMLKSQHFLF